MKSIILTAALIVAMGTASFASGNDSNGSRVVLVKSQTKDMYNLIYADDTPGKVLVKIYDAKGHLLRTDKIQNQKGFKQPYDMKNLAAGNYKIVISDSKGETSLLATLRSSEEMVVNKLGYNKYQLIYIDGTSGAASVGIYNETEELVFSEDVHFRNGFSKVYDLAEVTSTGFTFEVSSENKFRKVSF